MLTLTLTLTLTRACAVGGQHSGAAPTDAPTRRRLLLYSALRCSARVPMSAQRRPRYCDAAGTADPTPELTRDGRMTDNYRIMALDH